MSVLRLFVAANIWLSNLLDHALPARLREDGNGTFIADYLPRAARQGNVVYDLGGGSQPFISLEKKQLMGLEVIGLDATAEELAGAPAGVYDRKIVTDLCIFVGDGDADVVVCQATLEHVRDTAGAMRALASTVKPGGRVFLFAPSRNAVFARLNLALPEGAKRWILFSLFPKKATGHDGFEAYYDRCTPSEIESLASTNNFDVEERRLFWTSSYFRIFTPAFVLWRAWQGLAYLALGDNAAETFIFVLKKREPPAKR